MFKEKATGYEPLYRLKSIAPNVWIADGGWIRFYGLPFPTRMTVIRLTNGDIWVHSPIADKEGLSESVAALFAGLNDFCATPANTSVERMVEACSSSVQVDLPPLTLAVIFKNYD